MSKAEEKSKQYKDFREQCGIKDPVMLNEVEEAYYEGYHQAEKYLRDIFNNGWSEGYEVGRDSMEEDMEKDAVEEVVEVDSNGLACVNVDGYLPGDKIKVYILKEA